MAKMKTARRRLGGQGQKKDDVLAWIVRHCDQTYRRKNWAGPGVGRALKDVEVAEAHWRPRADQHNIAEMALHMAYWKDAVATILAGRTWKYDDAQNWRTVPPTANGWEHAQAELDEAHRRLMTVLRAVPQAQLMSKMRRNDRTIDFAVDITTHDTYHSAQIFVLRRLYRGRGV